LDRRKYKKLLTKRFKRCYISLRTNRRR